MKLLTKELLSRFKKVGRQDVDDPIVIAHFFNPQGAGDWYAVEYIPQDEVFFGYVSISGDHNDEWGYFSLAELSEYRGQLHLGIERDLHWDEIPASEVPKIAENWKP